MECDCLLTIAVLTNKPTFLHSYDIFHSQLIGNTHGCGQVCQWSIDNSVCIIFNCFIKSCSGSLKGNGFEMRIHMVICWNPCKIFLIEFYLPFFLYVIIITQIINNWVFYGGPIWCISVRLSDRSKVRQNKINFVKNCPQWGLNSQPPDHQSHALLTVLSHYLAVGISL